MNSSDSVFTSQQVHDIGCRCRSCLTMSALKRTSVVFLVLLLLWTVVFVAMGWDLTRLF
ncbi:hypothetical protein [Oligella urethralis]|uniref:hypothetical protein n=1 Tax=Oligella urethralis TaxID=90245 RepID=UPI0015E12725|nr:hypothetical protein [Oligella urethralis]